MNELKRVATYGFTNSQAKAQGEEDHQEAGARRPALRNGFSTAGINSTTLQEALDKIKAQKAAAEKARLLPLPTQWLRLGLSNHNFD